MDTFQTIFLGTEPQNGQLRITYSADLHHLSGNQNCLASLRSRDGLTAVFADLRTPVINLQRQGDTAANTIVFRMLSVAGNSDKHGKEAVPVISISGDISHVPPLELVNLANLEEKYHREQHYYTLADKNEKERAGHYCCVNMLCEGSNAKFSETISKDAITLSALFHDGKYALPADISFSFTHLWGRGGLRERIVAIPAEIGLKMMLRAYQDRASNEIMVPARKIDPWQAVMTLPAVSVFAGQLEQAGLSKRSNPNDN